MQSLDLNLNKDDDKWEQVSKYLDKKDHDVLKIKRAFAFATNFHSTQLRMSGEPYMVHPGWIARVVSQLGVGDEAIIACLLHDCVEDTKATLEDISNGFGDEVALLVSGLTEVRENTKLIVLHDTNIESFRRFLFSSVDDVRILIIRIVDKVHNGLTISSLSEERQKRFAKMVLGIYSPVAEYVGLHRFKQILDDISFEILEPEKFFQIKTILESRKQEEEITLEIIKKSVINLLKINHIQKYEIQTRIKSIYSTYRKMRKYKDEFNLKDRIGLRILIQDIKDCYDVLGLLHSTHPYIQEEFHDYISNPKPNGYRSLQTTFKWDEMSVEIQIRTFDMHEFNEFGPASHIAYKMFGSEKPGKGMEWVKDLVAWEKNKEKDINNYKIKVLQDYIYVFTPKGDALQLPKGASALDFAYLIHKDIGDRTNGILVNKKMVKISHTLQTGDHVEVITGSKINTTRDWLDIVVSKHSKDKIRQTLHALSAI